MVSLTEWAQVAPGMAVVTTPTGARLHQLGLCCDMYSEPMTAAGTLESTARLLDGALVAAEQAATREARPAMQMTPLRYAWKVAGYYHSTHATPRVMTRAVERFEALGRPDLAGFAQGKVDEEAGHDELALADLRALGYEADALVAAIVPPGPAALVAAEDRTVEGDEPIASLGYGYAIERSSTRIGAGYLEALQEILGHGVFATRCLRVHSALGADVEHVQSAVRFIAGMPGQDRTRIAAAVYEAALLIYGTHDGQDPPESELACLLAEYRQVLRTN